MNKEAVKLIIEVFQEQQKIMKPYYELLGEGLAKIEGAWDDTIYKFAKLLGISEEWIDACIDLVMLGSCNFTLNNGEDYTAHNIDDFIWAMEH